MKPATSLTAVAAFTLLMLCTRYGVSEVHDEGVLTLDRALDLALKHNPRLAAASHGLRAAEALARQAGRWRNPELAFEVEEYDRGGAGFDSAETVVSLGQTIELGGKRRRRRAVAVAEGELLGWDYEALRMDVVRATTDRFDDVLAAQRRLELAQSMVDLAEKTAHAVSERVNAGKEPPLQKSEAVAELEMVRLRAQEAQNRLAAARRALAVMWGASAGSFEAATGSLNHASASLPGLEELKKRLRANPDWARWESELQLRRAVLGEAKAARIPDLEASVGYAQYEEDGTDAFTVGVGMELPLFDRNTGTVAAARGRVAQAEAARRGAELELIRQLSEAHANLVLAYRKVVALRENVVPAMQEAFDAASAGYRQGKLSLLEMLDVQRGLFEARGALVDAQVDCRKSIAGIERLIGSKLEGK